MLDRKAHWEKVYAERCEEGVSWFQERPERSLALIGSCNLPKDAPIVDVGAGASRLADALLDAGYTDVTLLDVSAKALALGAARLGHRALMVKRVEGDVLEFAPKTRFALWHDRAVFHFLTEAADRKRYAAVLWSALKPGGFALIASFAPDGPEKCSGLPVRRYDEESLLAELPGFSLLRAESEAHKTPWDAVQRFRYFLLQKKAPAA